MPLVFPALAAVAAWAFLALARLAAHRGAPRLDPAPAPADAPAVAAVIPARNEAQSIGAVIAALRASDYPGGLSVVLVDDGSTDGTADAARGAAGSLDLSIIAAPPLQKGWSGKLAAVHAGVAAADRHARYLLFIDADIALAPATLSTLVAHAERERLDLVSLMARLDSRGFWGALLVPAFVFFFQKLYPFHRINEDAAAAAGGCMLIRRETYDRAGGVAAFKDALIDDCAMARAIRSAGGRLSLSLADEEARSLRDNRSLASIWSMVERTAFTQLRHSWALVALAFAGMGLLYWTAPVIFVASAFVGDKASMTLALAAFALMMTAYRPTARLYGLGLAGTAMLPVAAFLYALMTVSSAIRHASGKGGAWKGRVYP
jgi:hopene-associated glycosyltransferase HpnB